MVDLHDLYKDVLVEHSRAPRNYRGMSSANRRAEGDNPLCGDHLTVYLHVEGDSIREVSFQGSGCAISKASASIMTEVVKGKTRTEAERLFERFQKLITGQAAGDENHSELCKLDAFCGLSKFPAREKCAKLAWHTLLAALEGKAEAVSMD